MVWALDEKGRDVNLGGCFPKASRGVRPHFSYTFMNMKTLLAVVMALGALSLDAQEPSESPVQHARDLLRTVLAGDDSVRGQAAEAVAAALTDKGLLVAERFELATLRELTRVQAYGADVNRLRIEREVSARRLMAEFPGESGGYEALMREADNHPNGEHAAALAGELLGMAEAPPAVKSAARLLRDRLDLLGQNWLAVVEEAWGESDDRVALSTGRPMVIYTWASWSPGSLRDARELAQALPAGVALYGLCLDADPAARVEDGEGEIPGEPLEDPPGKGGRLARALGVGGAFPVYVIGPGGDFVEVMGERSSPTTLAARVERGRD